VKRLTPRHDDEDTGVAVRSALGRDDRVPLARARDAGDPRFDPRERSARIAELAAQDTWGSMSP
jgi:hypothetical protein